jgi:predicted nucleic acid-binding protein
MKIFIDTNVVLDVLARREPFYEASRGVWELVEKTEVRGYLSAASITDVFYILRKHLGPQGAYDTVSKLLLVFLVASVSEKDIRMALVLGGKDFEDALQVVCAKRIRADYLITRDKGDFADSEGIKIVTPEEFLKVVKK